MDEEKKKSEQDQNDDGTGNLQNLKNSWEAPLKLVELKFKSKDKDEQEVLTYAETLHNALKSLWLPMVLMGRLPFWLELKNNRAHIVVNKKSFAYLFCLVTCSFTWILFIWITIGLVVLAAEIPTKIDVLRNQQTSKVSVALARRYWMDVFIFWTTLLQACVSNSHIIYEADELAEFVKAWYRVLDITKIEVSRTLILYISKSLVVLGLVIIFIVVLYNYQEFFRHTEGTCEVIVIALAQPIIIIARITDKFTRGESELFYFQKFSWLGLVLYILSIIFSWLYVIQFMVFCRCFRKGLKCINERIAMILVIDDAQQIGPNAQRLTYEYVHKDYLGIATTGIKIGKVFSWTMCNYYLWATLVLVVELGEIFTFAKKDYRLGIVSPDEKFLGESKAGLGDIVPPVEAIANSLMHLVATTVSIFYVSHEGSGAHKESKVAYELARYKGIVDCSSQLERNFIRSIWIIVTDKCPVHVSPGNFFGITNSTVLTVFATAFTYFIFWVQSIGQIQDLTGLHSV